MAGENPQDDVLEGGQDQVAQVGTARFGVGTSWLDGLADQVHAVFPRAVVVVNGQYVGTRVDVDGSVGEAFKPVDRYGHLSDDPRLVVIRRQRSILVRNALDE